MYDLVVIGNPSFDLITNRISRNNSRVLSGPMMYTARSAALLGIENMAIIGALSSEHHDFFIDQLYELGIPEYYTLDSPDTGGFEIQYDNDGNYSFLSLLGVPRSIGIRDIPEEFLSTRIIVLAPLLQEIDAELIEWICNSTDATIILDPQLRTNGSNNTIAIVSQLNVIEKTRSYLDFIKPNENEATLISGEKDVFLAAELLVESLAENCIITRGSQGCLLYDGDEFVQIPAYKANAIDTLGAGAVFSAGFSLGLLETEDLPECAALGLSAASFKIETSGMNFILNREKIQARAKELVCESDIR